MKGVLILALAGLGFGLVLKFYVGGEPVGVSMLVALLGAPIVGTLATIDDDLPGGWSNPDGKTRPPWLHWQPWLLLALDGCIAGFGFAIDAGIMTVGAVPWLLLGSAGVAGSYLLFRRLERIEPI